MKRPTDGEADILRELNADAAACEAAWRREMTEEEMEEICESYDCLEDVVDAVYNSDPTATDDTDYPY